MIIDVGSHSYFSFMSYVTLGSLIRFLNLDIQFRMEMIMITLQGCWGNK